MIKPFDIALRSRASSALHKQGVSLLETASHSSNCLQLLQGGGLPIGFSGYLPTVLEPTDSSDLGQNPCMRRLQVQHSGSDAAPSSTGMSRLQGQRSGIDPQLGSGPSRLQGQHSGIDPGLFISGHSRLQMQHSGQRLNSGDLNVSGSCMGRLSQEDSNLPLLNFSKAFGSDIDQKVSACMPIYYCGAIHGGTVKNQSTCACHSAPSRQPRLLRRYVFVTDKTKHLCICHMHRPLCISWM